MRDVARVFVAIFACAADKRVEAAQVIALDVELEDIVRLALGVEHANLGQRSANWAEASDYLAHFVCVVGVQTELDGNVGVGLAGVVALAIVADFIVDARLRDRLADLHKELGHIRRQLYLRAAEAVRLSFGQPVCVLLHKKTSPRPRHSPYRPKYQLLKACR